LLSTADYVWPAEGSQIGPFFAFSQAPAVMGRSEKCAKNSGATGSVAICRDHFTLARPGCGHDFTSKGGGGG
jgi:hypothetical protein